MQLTTLTLESVTETTTGATEFMFQPQRSVAYRAGQAGLLIVPGGGTKPFTFSSDAGSGLVSVATSLGSGSRFKRALGRLEPGGQVRVIAAIGAALVPQQGAHEVLVAQGIGITPFLSAARTYGALDATLLQVGAAHYFDETATAMRDAQHFQHRDGLSAAVDQAIAARPDARWSISGRGDFVSDFARQLSAAGVPARRIRKDAFWGMRAVRLTSDGATAAIVHA